MTPSSLSGHHFSLDVPGKPQDEPAEKPLRTSTRRRAVSAETALRDVIRIAVPNWIADFDADAVEGVGRKTHRGGRAPRRDCGKPRSARLHRIHQLQQIITKHWDPEVKAILMIRSGPMSISGSSSTSGTRSATPVPCFRPNGCCSQEQQVRFETSSPAIAQRPMGRRHTTHRSTRHATTAAATDTRAHSFSLFRFPHWVGLAAHRRGDRSRIRAGEQQISRGRELLARVTLLPGDAKPLTFGDYAPLADASGNRATITWTVGEDDVGEYRQVVIALANAGRYHRPRRMGRWRAVPLPRQPAS